jgi:hypothetical protein
MPDSRAGVLGVAGIFMQSDLAWKCSHFIDLLVEALHKTVLTIRTKNVGPLQVIVFVGSPLTLYGLPLRG